MTLAHGGVLNSGGGLGNWGTIGRAGILNIVREGFGA